jgi:hypothetical protein
MQKKPRGGARPGAGRPALLTLSQQLRLGEAIKRRLQRRTIAAFRDSVDAKVSEDDLEKRLRELETISPADRYAWGSMRREKYGEGSTYDAPFDESSIGEQLEHIKIEITMGGLRKTRQLHAPRLAFPGLRAKVLASVARAVARQCGVIISERTAKRCLDLYQAYARA